MNYKEKYIQSILSNISYIDLNLTDNSFINLDLSIPDNSVLLNQAIYNYYYADKPSTANEIYNNMLSSINFFSKNFIIKKQIVHTGFDGFSAITYQLKNDISDTSFKQNDIFVSYRGTEANQSGDIVTDIMLSFTPGIFKFKNSQEEQALAYIKEEIKKNSRIRICGHSLGGYLAARSYYYLNDQEAKNIIDVTTFNGAGFSTVLGSPFIYKDTKYGDKVTNFFAYRGLEVTTGDINEFLKGDGNISLFQHLGKRIKLVTENPGGIGNHSMNLIVTALGFYSVLQNLLEINNTLKDFDNNQLNAEREYSYAIERIMMSSLREEKDFEKLFSTLAKKLIESFGLPVNPQIYLSPISQVLSLQETLLLNSELKIELIDGISFSPYGMDSNRKRSIMYSILNDIPYISVVPEHYNIGIYNKENKNNDKYNMEYYNKDFLVLRTLYNSIITYLMEKKILDGEDISYIKPKLSDQPSISELNLIEIYKHINSVIGHEVISESNINKFAFIDYSNQNRIIYVNTNKNDFKAENAKAIYFSGYRPYSNVIYDNSIIFDSFEQNSININSNNSIIYSLNGYDSITFHPNTYNSLYLVDEMPPKNNVTKTLHNLSSSPIDIKFQNYNLNEIVIADRGQNNIAIYIGKMAIYTDGIFNFNLIAKDITINSTQIKDILYYFNDNFINDNSSNLIINNEFLDKYRKITKKNFTSINGENEETITQEHFDFVKDQIENYYYKKAYKPNTNLRAMRVLSVNTESTDEEIKDQLIEYMRGKIEKQSITVNDLVPYIQGQFDYAMRTREYSSDIKDIFAPKFAEFTNSNFSLTEEFDMNENAAYEKKIDDVYYKKETPIRDKTFDEHGNWNGKSSFSGQYTYNRQLNDVQLEFVYSDNLEEGEAIKYYKENILVNAISSQYSELPVIGSKGSDIIYTNGDIQGQPDDHDKNTNNILVSEKGTVNINHGNNFIIGKIVKAGDGSNLVYNSRNVTFNQNRTSSTQDNYVLDCDGLILSGKGKTYSSYCNTVLGNGLNLSIKDSLFIGGKEASLLYKTFLINEGAYDPTPDPLIAEYYNFNQSSLGQNKVYPSNGIALLNPNDYAYAKNSTVYGVGNNQIVSINSEVRSGGNSNIEIYDKSKVFLGLNDTFTTNKARESTIFGVNNANTPITYNIDGDMNHLQLGYGEYTVNFNGSSSKLTVTEDNSLLAVNVNEIGENTIDLQNLETFNLNTNTSSKIKIGDIDEINYEYTGYIKSELTKKEKNDLLTNINLIGDGNSYIEVIGKNLTINDLKSNESSSLLIDLDESSSVNNIETKSTSSIYLRKKNSTENIDLKTERANIKLKNSSDLNLDYIEQENSIITMTDADELILDIPYDSICYLNCNQINNLVIDRGNIRLNSFDDNSSSIENLTINMDNTVFSLFNKPVENIVLNSTQSVQITFDKQTFLFNDIELYNIATVNINNKTFSSSELTSIWGNKPLNSTSLVLNENGYEYINPIVEPSTPENEYILISGTDNDDLFFINQNSNYRIESSNGNDIYQISNDTSNTNLFSFNNTIGVSTFKAESNANLNIDLIQNQKQNVSFDILKDEIEYFENLHILLNDELIIKIINYNLFSLNLKLKDSEDNEIYISIDEIESNIYDIYGVSYSDTIDGHENKLSNIYLTDNTRIVNLKGAVNNIYFYENNHDLLINCPNTSSYSIFFNSSIDIDNLTYALDGTTGIIISYNAIQLLNLSYAFSGTLIQFDSDKQISCSSILSGLKNINGTDNDEVIYGNNSGESFIYPFKGNDIINIVAGNNSIYYNIGDGKKIINNPNKAQVRVILPEAIDRSLLQFSLKNQDSVYVVYNSEMILEWENVNFGYIQFGNTNNMIFGYQMLSNNPTEPTEPVNPTNPNTQVIINGSENDDIQSLSEFKEYVINSSNGNDIYSFTVSNSNLNKLNYTVGSGFTTLKTVGNIVVSLSINLDIDISDLNFNIIKNQFGNEAELIIEYQNIPIIKLNNALNFIFNLNVKDNNVLKTLSYSDIENIIFSIIGTDADEVLNGNTATSLFYPKKGNDSINIVSGINKIYYNIGDGIKTIFNPTYSSLTIVLESNILKENLSYEISENNSLNISINSSLAFIIRQPNSGSIQLLNNMEFINFFQKIQELSTINGTDSDETINGNLNGSSIINVGKGNDIINLLGGQNTINYSIGDGCKQIISSDIFYMININGSADISLFSYQKNSENGLDIKYDDILIFKISDPYNATIVLTNTFEYIYASQIYDELNAIQGTDENDILYGTENGDYFIGKKGDDEINLIGGYNTIEYNVGDGHDSIKGNFANIIRLSGIDSQSLSFSMNGDSMDVLYNNEIILTVEYPEMCSIQITETYEIIYLSDYLT